MCEHNNIHVNGQCIQVSVVVTVGCLIAASTVHPRATAGCQRRTLFKNVMNFNFPDIKGDSTPGRGGPPFSGVVVLVVGDGARDVLVAADGDALQHLLVEAACRPWR
jgi:hypothetical protein